MIEIRRSKAYSNSFFEKAKDGASHESMVLFIKEWFPVTQAFCLALPSYMALLAKEVLTSHRDRRDTLEEAMLVPLAIGAGEFGMGAHGIDAIHYRMFARLGEPHGLCLDNLRRYSRGTLAETGRLVDGIEETLADPYLGAGCIRVVEGTAYNIVAAMHQLCSAITWPDGKPVYTTRQMEYITLHMELEKEHDVMAAEFVELLCDTLEHRSRINAGIERMCGLFGEYWEAVAGAVFGETQCK